MQFELLPVLDDMLELYRHPRTFDRFKEFLSMLQGNTKGDMEKPLGGFNPMAGAAAARKLGELKTLGAETLIQEVLAAWNGAGERISEVGDRFSISLVLSDDLYGGWTNRYTTDYTNRFLMQALVKRKQAVIVFWTSEPYTPDLIRTRALEHAHRTRYWLEHSRPKTLKEHFCQEKNVSRFAGIRYPEEPLDKERLGFFLREHAGSEDYSVIFNFFYGDAVCRELEYPTFGISDHLGGFRLAAAFPGSG